MKKVLLIVSLFILLLFLAAIILPIAFKGKIISAIKEQANANLNAVVNFDENIHLGLLKSFPNLNLGIANIEIINKSPFEGDTLASIDKLEVRLDLVQAIKGNIEIKKILLDRPSIYTHVLNDTLLYTANWDITLPSTDTTETTEEEESVFSLPVKKIVITNGKFVYNDELYFTYIEMDGLNLSGLGNFGMDVFDLAATLEAEKTEFRYDGIPYLHKVKTNLDALFSMDMVNYIFTFKENVLRLNKLVLNFDGSIAMPAEDIDFDLKFNTPQTDFKDLVSLVPAVYYSDFEKLKASGNMNFNGIFKGSYGEESMPAFNINLGIDNGYFKYPDLPVPLNNVNLDLNLNSPDEDMAHLIVDLKKLHFELDKEPFDARMLIKNIETNPYVDADIKGRIDLNRVKDLVPLEEKLKISGVVKTDLHLKGNSSMIENENYEALDAKGSLDISNLVYFYPELEKDIKIESMSLAFNPKSVELELKELSIDNNDLSAKGSLTNFIPYVLSDDTVYGNLDISSRYFNLNPFLFSDETQVEQAVENDTSESQMETVILPADISFNMDASFGQLIYDKLDMKNATCALQLSNQRLTINNLNADIVDGSIRVNGYYDTKTPDRPMADLNLDFSNFALNKVASSFSIVKKFVPVIDHLEGITHAKLSFSSLLGDGMMPVLSSIGSKGILSIKTLKVQKFEPLNLLAKTLNMKELKTFETQNIQPSYKIENGRFYFTRPIKFNVAGSEFEILEGSSNGLDKSIEYFYNIKMPADKLKANTTLLANQLSGQNINLPVGSYVNLLVEMTGTVDKPRIKTSLKENVNDYKQQVKERVNNEIEKQKKELEDKAKQELEKQKAELERKAKEEAERLKKEAEEKARKELEAQKKKLKEEAKKKLKKIIKK